MTNTSTPKDTLSYVLLGFLSQQPMHGYDLYKHLQNLDGEDFHWRVKKSLMYAELDKLLKENMLEFVIEPVPGRPYRKVFSITSSGRLEFENWVVKTVDHPREMRLEFLARLFFCLHRGKKETLQLANAQLLVCDDWLQRLEEESKKCAGERKYALVVYQFRINQVLAFKKWLSSIDRFI